MFIHSRGFAKVILLSFLGIQSFYAMALSETKSFAVENKNFTVENFALQDKIFTTQNQELKKKNEPPTSMKQRLIDWLWKELSPTPFEAENKQNPRESDEKQAQQSKKKKASKKKVTQPSSSLTACTVELVIEGAIGALTLDILDQAIRKTKKNNCSSLLLLINTPGGMLITTRKIVDRILNAEFPVLCLVYPSGAHAGSAGAIILQACHVNGAMEATNLGAATPILGSGKNAPEDLRKKMINDTTSWMDSLTELRKRNKKFGREIITKARAVSAKTAVKEKAIDFVGNTKMDFLQFAKGRRVTIKDGKQSTVKVGDLLPTPLGFRYQLLSLLTAPEFVYLLFTASLFLLYYEITHPGLGAPGILGIMGLTLAFVGMHKLAFSWGGLFLLILSAMLFLTEIFVPGFGIFGSAAVVSFVIGSFLIFDPAQTGGIDIPTSLIITVSSIFSSLMMIMTYLAWSTVRIKKTKEVNDDFLRSESQFSRIIEVDESKTSGWLFINGENWRFQSQSPVKKGDRVKVLCYKGLVLEVEPVEKT